MTRPLCTTPRRPVIRIMGIIGLLMIAACSGHPTPGAMDLAQYSKAAPSQNSFPTRLGVSQECYRAYTSQFTIEHKLAQLLTVGVSDIEDARSVVQRYQVGGIFIGSWTDRAVLRDHQLASLHKLTPIPLWVAIDEEGGRVSRLSALGFSTPSARELAQRFSVQQVESLAFKVGQRLKSYGITVDFAPDVDVSDEPDDAVIGDRSFSNDPQVVIAYARAYIQGLRKAGITPVIKHFPGHGHASGDSHTGSVTTPALQELKHNDLLPFRALTPLPVAVMVGHMTVPGLTHGKPASVSTSAYTLLRHGVGYGAQPFSGPIFTDDLSGMQAVSRYYSIVDAVVAAITAGATSALWLTTSEVAHVIAGLHSAVRSGKLTMNMVDDALVVNGLAKGAVHCA